MGQRKVRHVEGRSSEPVLSAASFPLVFNIAGPHEEYVHFVNALMGEQAADRVSLIRLSHKH